MATGTLERLDGLTKQKLDRQQRQHATKQELLLQVVFDTIEPARLEERLVEADTTSEVMSEARSVIHGRMADAKMMAVGEVAQQERVALAAEEQADITWFEARRAEFDARQAVRTVKSQEIESRLFAATEARRRLGQTYRDPSIDETLARCHGRLREVVDGMRQLQDSINARSAKLKQSQASNAPDAKDAVAFSEAKLQEYQATMAELSKERQTLQAEIAEAEARKLDPLSVVI